MPLTETLTITSQIVSIFEQINVRCAVGGSVSSSFHGIPRATQDVDVVVSLFASQVSSLIEKLEDKFYVEEQAVRAAVDSLSSFNIIHLDSMYKADVFVCGNDELKLEELNRAVEFITDPSTNSSILVVSATDIIIQKLIWYDMGNRVSTRQWDDVIGVIQVSGDQLDMDYLKKWSKIKNIEKLVALAFKQAKQ